MGSSYTPRPRQVIPSVIALTVHLHTLYLSKKKDSAQPTEEKLKRSGQRSRKLTDLQAVHVQEKVKVSKFVGRALSRQNRLQTLKSNHVAILRIDLGRANLVHFKFTQLSSTRTTVYPTQPSILECLTLPEARREVLSQLRNREPKQH